MFVQVIRGRAADPAGLRRQADRWAHELASGAGGWLGSTIGVAANGEAVAVARFRDAAAAEANSRRPEQGDWWNETVKCFDGEPTFVDSTDIDEFRVGGSDDAGFVQIMSGRCTDKAKLRELDAQFEQLMGRPDLVGGIRAWHGDDEFVEIAYFTSEEEARQGEAAPVPPEAAGAMQQWQSICPDMGFLDLPDPWLYSP